MRKNLPFLMALLSFNAFFEAQIQKISFETAEGYTVGNLGGQQGWTVWGGLPVTNAQVVSSNPTDGINSFNMLSGGLIQDACGIEKNISTLVTGTDVEISFDYNFASLNGSDYEIALYNDGINYAYTAAFRINYMTGVLSYRTATGFVAGPTLTPNLWNNLKIVIRQSTNTLQYFSNGTQIYTGSLGTSQNAQIIDFVYDDYGSGFRVDNIQVNNIPALSTEEVSRKASIKIYPNPTTEKLNIESEEKISSIAIFDAKGSLIKSIHDGGISNGKVVDVSEFEVGVYLIKVKTSASEFTKKIIKK